MIRNPIFYFLILLLAFGIYFPVFVTDASSEVILLSPNNEAPDMSSDVTLKWRFISSDNLQKYVLSMHRKGDAGKAWVPIEVSRYVCDKESDTGYEVCAIGVLSFANIISIDAGGYEYEWWIAAQDGAGNGIGSSEVRSFTTAQLPGPIIPPPPPEPPGPGEDPDPEPGPVTPPVVGIFQFENPISSNTLPELIGKLLNLIFGLSIVITPLVILYAGFLMLTAAGDAAKLQKAKSILIWTVIAFAIILVAKGAPNVIQSIL